MPCRLMRLCVWGSSAAGTPCDAESQPLPPAVCGYPAPSPAGSPFSLLSLANNCGMASSLAGVQHRFLQLLRRRLCEPCCDDERGGCPTASVKMMT